LILIHEKETNGTQTPVTAECDAIQKITHLIAEKHCLADSQSTDGTHSISDSHSTVNDHGEPQSTSYSHCLDDSHLFAESNSDADLRYTSMAEKMLIHLSLTSCIPLRNCIQLWIRISTQPVWTKLPVTGMLPLILKSAERRFMKMRQRSQAISALSILLL
jgi:hypothetical protein